MIKNLIAIIFAAVLFSGCAHEFNQVYKSQDYTYKYEYAKEAFARGKYVQAITLLQELVTIQKGTDNAEESLEQIFGAIEIPLYARYLLNANNKIAFTLIGGISGGFIVNNKVYLETNEDKELLGSTENIRNFNLSTDFSVGIEYPVTNKIKIMIEPGFRYYLQSLSTNELIDFKPYSFTLSTGVGIKF